MTELELVRSIVEREIDPRPLPVPMLKTPAYRPGRYGDWTLVNQHDSLAAVGYFRGLRFIDGFTNFALMRDGVVWMSLSPMELESQAIHLDAAYGEVVVAGLGMGALVYNLLQKPEVRRVTVVERDPAVIELLYKIASPKRWPRADKLQIRQGDALHYPHDWTVDTLLADIWPKLAATEALGDMIQMQSRMNAKSVGWWGQEYDIVHFLSTRGYHAPVLPEHLDLFVRETGLPIVGPEIAGYCTLITDAIKNGLHPLTMQASAIAKPLDPLMSLGEARKRRLLFPEQPFQWHLTTTAHDRCPEGCGAEIANLGVRDRYCMKCHKGWKLTAKPLAWLRLMITSKAKVATRPAATA